MNQTRLFIQADKAVSENIARAVEAAFEEDGLPVSLSENENNPNIWTVSIYADTAEIDVIEARLIAILEDMKIDLDIQHEELADIDWIAETLRKLGPVRAGRFIVHGSHDRHIPACHQHAIEIDAGQAFGTGHHGTTAGCLDMLDHCLKSSRFFNALDLGTGSGVLAIAMARATNAKILATDIDPVAVHVTRTNFRSNRCQRRVKTAVSRGLDHRIFAETGPFDLIAANILAGPLQKMAAPIFRHMSPTATLILSGLLPHQKARIVATYRSQGLALAHSHIRDGWLTLVLQRQAAISFASGGSRDRK